MYNVIVPLKERKKVKGRWINAVSYPASGQSPYTREQAVKVLQRFHERHPLPDGDPLEPYAESLPGYSPAERFTVQFPDDLTVHPQTV